MRVLYIGGTGIISSASVDELLAAGVDVTLLTRGESIRPLPEGVTHLQVDIRDRQAAEAALAGHVFDVVVDWVAFSPNDIARDIALFRDRTGQYVFISSASVYQKPPAALPVTEETPAENPHWEYARQKIACEERLRQAHDETGFPATIVRPSHTYDRTLLPFRGGYTVVDRMRRKLPIIVHGDGTSLWTLTHHRDFARGFNGLLGLDAAIGETIHITSDEWLTWDQIAMLVAEAFGLTAEIVHVPSEMMAAFEPSWRGSLLGDKSHSMIFDNSKIKRLVPGFAATIPYADGVREVAAYFDETPAARQVDAALDATIERIIAAQRSAYPAV